MRLFRKNDEFGSVTAFRDRMNALSFPPEAVRGTVVARPVGFSVLKAAEVTSIPVPRGDRPIDFPIDDEEGFAPVQDKPVITREQLRQNIAATLTAPDSVYDLYQIID